MRTRHLGVLSAMAWFTTITAEVVSFTLVAKDKVAIETLAVFIKKENSY
jgi:predicted membrane chloride channel (bestrophin family)